MSELAAETETKRERSPKSDRETVILEAGQARETVIVAVLFLVLAATVFAIYRPALGHFFIADDLINLDFVRSYRGSLSDFVDPTQTYSDPVTQSRYKPLYTYYLYALDGLFGDRAALYHAWSFLLHALVALSVFLLARRLALSLPVAVSAAFLMLCYRLNSQMVVWISANYRLLSVLFFLLAILAVYSRRFRLGLVFTASFFGLGLFMNPDVLVLPAILGLFAAYYRFGSLRDGQLARRFFQAAMVCGIVALVFVVLNVISGRYFPDRPVSLVPSPSRVLAFGQTLVAPVAAASALKILLLAALLAMVVVARDARLWLLLGACAVGALFWGMLSAYPLTPRYFYLFVCFYAIALPSLLQRLASTLIGWLERRRAEPRRARPAFVLVALMTCLVTANVVAIRSRDLVSFEYLALLGRKLDAIALTAKRKGVRARVYIRPRSHLGKRDLAFFRHHIAFVDKPEQATDVVDTMRARYRRLFGPRFDHRYWHFPWLTRAGLIRHYLEPVFAPPQRK
jgi:hypothetical protein